ncbi:MAG: hypothetical protein E7663_04730 [Ruminococcaceae bacterium]|nr:hypothetical protein [Oscillospiraceae bacterium]
MASEFVIRIEDGTGMSSAAPVASDTPSSPVSEQPRNKVPPSASSYVASKMLQPAARSIASHITASVAIETGSQELQQKTDLAMMGVSTVMSGWSNISGAMALFGGPAGAIAGIAVTAMGVAVQYGIKQAQVKQQQRVENEQLELYRSRFGLGFDNSRQGGTS